MPRYFIDIDGDFYIETDEGFSRTGVECELFHVKDSDIRPSEHNGKELTSQQLASVLRILYEILPESDGDVP